MRLISTIVALLILIVPMDLYADTTRAIVIHNGVPGYWFNEATGNLLLGDLEELKIIRSKITLLEDKLELKDVRLRMFESELKISDEISLKYQHMYELQLDITDKYITQYEKCMEKENKWYKHPVIWTFFGFLLGALTTVGVTYSVSTAR